MAARKVRLAPKKAKRRSKRRHVISKFLHTLGAGGLFVMAAAMNFALYPDALADVAGLERHIAGFVPDAPPLDPVLPAPVPLDETEVRLLAATAWAEARGEGEDGMRAVAHVIVNRVGHRFGGDLETVILAPKQFSAWNLGDPNRPLAQNPEAYATAGINLETWEAAQRVAREVLSGQSVDPTAGALFYHARAIRPWWSRYGEGRREIGAHVFYHDVPDRPARAPRVTQVADTTPRPIEDDTAARGPRAGRVNGVIQHAAASAAQQPLPSENDAATPTLDGVPITELGAAP